MSDPAAAPAQLGQAIRGEGETAVVDGMATAPDSALYLTGIEHHAVIRRAPDGHLSMVAHDPRLIAHDSMALVGNTLWLTVGQWVRLPVFHAGHDMEQRPWLLVALSPH